MTSSAKERPDGEERQPAPLASGAQDVDNGCSPKTADAVGSGTADRDSSATKEALREEAPSTSTAETPPEVAGAHEAPAEALRSVETRASAEAGAMLEAPSTMQAPPLNEPSPKTPSRSGLEAEGESETAPPARVSPPLITPPPAAEAAPPPGRSAPSKPDAHSEMAAAELAEASTDRAGFWATRPSKAWSLAGLIGMIAALGVGILIGRAQGGDGDRGRVAPTVAPPTPTPTAEKAPVAAAGPSASAPAESPAKAGPAVKHASATFDAQAAKLAIDRMLPRLKDCKRPGEPPGSATVTVTFAPSGRVSEAAVTTTRYAGTRTGKCIEARLRALRIAEFTGKPVTVKRGIAVR